MVYFCNRRMLTKYTLVNMPEGGVRHPVGNLGLISIDDNLTDAMADEAIEAGLGYYFKKKESVVSGPKADGKDAK